MNRVSEEFPKLHRSFLNQLLSKPRQHPVYPAEFNYKFVPLVICSDVSPVNHPPGSSLMFHSDRVVQYACGEFAGLLADHDITQSMSPKGNSWDNAPAEKLFQNTEKLVGYAHKI